MRMKHFRLMRNYWRIMFSRPMGFWTLKLLQRQTNCSFIDTGSECCLFLGQWTNDAAILAAKVSEDFKISVTYNIMKRGRVRLAQWGQRIEGWPGPASCPPYLNAVPGRRGLYCAMMDGPYRLSWQGLLSCELPEIPAARPVQRHYYSRPLPSPWSS